MRAGTRRSRLFGWASGFAMILVAGGILGCGNGDAQSEGVLSMVVAPTVPSGDSAGTNHAPVIDRIVIRPEHPAPGRRVQASARVSDPDGDPTSVVYRWQTARGRTLGEGRTFDTTGLEPGSRLEVIAIASDGVTEGESLAHEFRLSQPPLVISVVAIDFSEGTKPGALLRAVVELENEGSSRVEPELAWKVNGEIVGSDTELETQRFLPGDIVILRARINRGDQRTRPVSSAALVLSRGGAPEILSKPLSGIESGLFRYQIRARSTESDAKLTYEILKGPDGMSIGADSGLVEWRPRSDQRGRFEIELSATDQWGSGVAQSFTIVADAPMPPAARAR